MSDPQGASPAKPVAVVKLRELTDTDREIFDLERTWWKYADAKEHAIRQKFDYSTAWCYRRLNALLDHEEAPAFDPLLVKRLRHPRQTRARSRSAERLGIDG